MTTIYQHEDMLEVWIWSELQGVFSHETALMMHNLSDALPAKMHVTLPRAWRFRKLELPPVVIAYYQDIPATDRCLLEGLPITTPRRTIDDCVAAHVDPFLVEQAVRQLGE